MSENENYPEPPRTDWAELALLSEADDPEDYRDIHGLVQDEENWRELQKQVIVPFETYGDFPAEAPFDGAKAEDKQSNVVFRWDSSASDWIALNTGTSENPVPGTSHYESLSSKQTKLTDNPESFENSRSMEHMALHPSPLIGSSTEDIGSTPWPTNTVGEYVLGWVNENGSYEIHRSDDGGGSWTALSQSPDNGRPRNIIGTDDGEILVAVGSGVYKSSGYPNNISWSEVLSMPSGSVIRTWGLDGDGSMFIVSHYDTGDRSDSRYAWSSTNAGDSWDIIYDSADHHPDDWEGMHLHGCAYDPWADRYWVLDAHSTSVQNAFYSDDGGSTWHTPEWESPLSSGKGIPTTITAARKGMVLGSDARGELGIYVIPRTEATEDQTVKFAYEFPSKRGGVSLIARTSRLDKRTGIAYVGFTGENEATASLRDDPALIAASDGVTGGLVWKEPNPTDESRIAYFALTPEQERLVGVLERDDASNQYLRGLLGHPGSQAPAQLDSGGVLGGERPTASSQAEFPSVAGGQSSIAGGRDSAVFGGAVEAKSRESSLFGYNIVADGRGTLVGQNVETSESRFAGVGNNIDIDGEFSSVLGWTAGAGLRSVALGAFSSANSEATAIGEGASASNRGISLGRNASSNVGGIAIGHEASAGSDELTIYIDGQLVLELDSDGNLKISGEFNQNATF